MARLVEHDGVVLVLNGSDQVIATLGNKSFPSWPRPRIALIGDSITLHNTDVQVNPTSYLCKGPFTWANMLLRHRLTLVDGTSYCHGGYTTQQLIDGAYVDGAAASDSDIVFIHAGTNDAGAGNSAASIAANLLKMWRTCTATGKLVIATTILPTNDNAGFDQVKRDANRLIRANAANEKHVLLCDWYSALIDPSTGIANTAYLLSGDHVHPNGVGGSRLGKVLSDLLGSLVGTYEDLCQDNIDTSDLLSNGLFTGNVAGLATSWLEFNDGSPSSVTLSKVARSDLFAGEWQQVVIAAVTPNTDGCHLQLNNGNVGTDWNVGDTVYASVEFETDAAAWDARNIELQLQFANASPALTVYDNQLSSTERTAQTTSLWRPTSGVLRTPAAVIPSSTTSLHFIIQMFGSMTIRFGRAQLVKVA